MTNLQNLPPVEELKSQAKRLRQSLAGKGTSIGHSEALEMIAHQYGARDWNTLHARAGNRFHLRVGDRVSGRYLGQPFEAEVKSLTSYGNGSHRRVTLQFDQPVDVVRFDSFSSLRQRVTGMIGWDGRSPQKTSDGVSQLILDRVLG